MLPNIFDDNMKTIKANENNYLKFVDNMSPKKKKKINESTEITESSNNESDIQYITE